jgi:hypothetical protein
MEASGKEHWAAVKQILCYIRGTQDFGCRYVSGGAARLVGFSDSDHAGDINDRKSTTGYMFFNNNLSLFRVSWGQCLHLSRIYIDQHTMYNTAGTRIQSESVSNTPPQSELHLLTTTYKIQIGLEMF